MSKYLSFWGISKSEREIRPKIRKDIPFGSLERFQVLLVAKRVTEESSAATC